MNSTIGRTLSLVVASLAIAALSASPASAHDELVDSSPEAGSTVNRPPSEVELVFNEGVQEQGSSIVVSLGDTTISQNDTFTVDGNTASVQLAEKGLAQGTYRVSYRIVSEDGHIVRESFSFDVAGASAATNQPDPSSTPTVGTTPISNEDSDESAGSVVWVLGAGAIGLVLVAALIAVAARGRRGRSS